MVKNKKFIKIDMQNISQQDRIVFFDIFVRLDKLLNTHGLQLEIKQKQKPLQIVRQVL